MNAAAAASLPSERKAIDREEEKAVKTGDSQHVCKMCKLRFEDVSTLEKHEKKPHKMYSCAGCGAEFFEPNKFQEHFVEKHMKPIPGGKA